MTPLVYSQDANPSDAVSRRLEEVLAAGRTRFQEYLFFRSRTNGVTIVLDGDVQSCEADEAIYHEALVHPAMLLSEEPRTVLVMGGGEGATAREVLRHPSVERVVMVDIDREFVDLCRRFIPEWGRSAFADPRLEVRYEDIFDYLARTPDSFDVAIGDLVDAPDPVSPAAELYSRSFYERLAPRIREGGILATQAGALRVGDDPDRRTARAGLAARFASVATYGIVVPSFYHLWGFVVASNRALELAPGALFERFEREAGRRGLGLPATGARALAAAFYPPAAVRAGE
ncbi:MAG: spermidine synthase [Planctomycetes bacterium]|nr:spermidine synthase [Planctomycetota bacterium]